VVLLLSKSYISGFNTIDKLNFEPSSSYIGYSDSTIFSCVLILSGYIANEDINIPKNICDNYFKIKKGTSSAVKTTFLQISYQYYNWEGLLLIIPYTTLYLFHKVLLI
jgi:hypothetical protein